MSGATAEGPTDGEVRESVMDAPDPASRPLYAIGDIHGHLAELDAALHAAGLTGPDGTWTGGDARVWFLGDFSDRGPDGVGVIDRIRGMAEQAESAGGEVVALLGNHELLLLGTHIFGDQVVPITYPERTFRMVWTLNGGQQSDLDRLTGEHAAWLRELDVVALAGEHLLMHSDTTSYLFYGDSVTEINAAVRAVLSGGDIEDWWLCFRRLTSRHEFRDEPGEESAKRVLDALGGRRIVHGHSTIPNQLGIDPTTITGPHQYADGRVLAIDAGIYQGGPCLVVRLA
ncbi:MAG TPA: metallophosphoesterase [Micromonosporaceae bacterium]|nr:metallophosphoesterase [Micromonosporaceae bacterium]